MLKKVKQLCKSKLAQNSMWMILLQGFNTIIPLLTLPYITRILSPSAYGGFSLALNWIGYLQVIVEYGFELTGSRKIVMRESDKDLDAIFSIIVLSRLFLLIICTAILSFIVIVIPVDKSQIVCMVILFLMVFAIVFQQTWFFQGMEEMKNIAIINVISRTISVIFIFTLVKSPKDLYLYCFLYVSNYLISGIIGCFIVYKKYHVRFKKVSILSIKKEIKEGWYLFLSSAMSKIFGSIGITILGILSTKSDVGIFSAINKIPYVLTLLFAALSQAIYPYNCKRFSVSFSEGVKNVKKVAKPIILLFGVMGMGLIILHYPIVKYAFGDVYAQKSTLLIPFIIWVIFGIINNFLGIQVLVASGHQKEYSKSFQVGVICMSFMMVVLGYIWKSYGIACASMLSEMLLCVLLYRNIKKISLDRI